MKHILIFAFILISLSGFSQRFNIERHETTNRLSVTDTTYIIRAYVSDDGTTWEDVFQDSTTTNVPYIWEASLTQTGTDAPVETVLKNTYGEEFTLAYNTTGRYTITSSSKFTENKTFVILSNQVPSDQLNYVVQYDWLDSSTLGIYTYRHPDDRDEVLKDCYIKIFTYK